MRIEDEIGHEEPDDDLGAELDEDAWQSASKKDKYTNKELEEWADALLREDANRELCRVCLGVTPNTLPYGKQTGHIEWQLQRGDDGVPLLDEEDNVLYVGFHELECHEGHYWFEGEGPRRNIKGPNPILFETHLYNRKRREIHVKDGIPDPAFTMDRWGKRPTVGQYNRSHPQGRRINSVEQRRTNGASYYRAYFLPLILPVMGAPPFITLVLLLAYGIYYIFRKHQQGVLGKGRTSW